MESKKTKRYMDIIKYICMDYQNAEMSAYILKLTTPALKGQLL